MRKVHELLIGAAPNTPGMADDLHQNIQDRFNEAGVEILSSHYIATRDGSGTTIPKTP